MDRFQKVAARTRGDVKDVHRAACRVSLLDGGSQCLLQERSADADRPPADGVEIDAIDETAEQRDALRPILVDVIQHQAGVEAVLPSQSDAAAQASRSLHEPTREGESQAAGLAQA